MPLIVCPDCGKKISNLSTVCIHCGYPIQSEANSNADNSFRIGPTNDLLNLREKEHRRPLEENRIRNQFRNLIGKDAGNGFKWRKWTWADGQLTPFVVFFKSGESVSGCIKDNEDGTFTIRKGIFSKKYFTFCWEDIEWIH